jgi:hypothetical protein
MTQVVAAGFVFTSIWSVGIWEAAHSRADSNPYMLQFFKKFAYSEGQPNRKG